MQIIPVIQINQISDEKWEDLSQLPWYTDEEIIRNQVTIEEALEYEKHRNVTN